MKLHNATLENMNFLKASISTLS